MFELQSIGVMVIEDRKCSLVIKTDYRKALKYTDLFSHMHVFYGEQETEERVLSHDIVRVIRMDIITGIMDLELIKRENRWITADVYDLKPYFPCEDSVRESWCNSKVNIQIPLIIKDIKEITRNSKENDKAAKVSLNEIGEVYHEGYTKYIEFNSAVDLTGLQECSHMKVIWWFHKFDDKRYRRIVECNPPYENAPRTGIFASRSPVRPSPLAMTIVRVCKWDLEKRRVYVHNPECFDGTPCLAVIPYDRDKDCVLDVSVPKWLEHWPKWLNDSESDNKIETYISGQDKENCREELKLVKKLYNESTKWELADETFQWNMKDEVPERKSIIVKGARQNNLKGFTCEIPYNEITAVVGVSGSGKSSLVQDTIYTECKRRMQCLSDLAGVIEKPNMDGMIGSIPAVMITQREIGRNTRSTIGTYSGVYECLRGIFASVGLQHCPKCKKPIFTFTEEEIINFLSSEQEVTIWTIEGYEADKNIPIQEQVHRTLSESKGALFARIGNHKQILLQTSRSCYHCDQLVFDITSATFNYTDPESMCPVCNGKAEVMEVDIQTIIPYPQLSILDGASPIWGKLRQFIKSPNANWMRGQVVAIGRAMDVDLEKPWCELTDSFKQRVLYGTGAEEVTFHYTNKKNGRNGSISRPAEGAVHLIERLYSENGNTDIADTYMKKTTCNSCKGERLREEGRQVTIGDFRYPEVAAMTFSECKDWCKQLPDIIGVNRFMMVKDLAYKIVEICDCAGSVGLAYLPLNRDTVTISGGERQRLKFLSGMQNQLSGILYILDEPSKGLHPKDYHMIGNQIKKLRDAGNTIIMVEHNEDMIDIADRVLEIGPKAGQLGGYLVGEYCLEDKNKEVIHRKRDIRSFIPRDLSKVKWLEIKSANHHNIHNVDVMVPIGAITCICGVSGSGKSSLVNGVIYPEVERAVKGMRNHTRCESITNASSFDEIIMVEQTPIGRTSRSVPATYLGIMDELRRVYANTDLAREVNFTESDFSFNNEGGQCTSCQGEGKITPKYAKDIYVTCLTCKGKRYKKQILEVLYRGKSIADLLEMSAEEVYDFIGKEDMIDDSTKRALSILKEVGLGYLKLGQSLSTLSGGEASRLKLARQLMEKKRQRALYLIDEPTTGLYLSDIENLMLVFQRLVDQGNTIVLIEHNKYVSANCDYIIEMGPGAGKEGGKIRGRDTKGCYC